MLYDFFFASILIALAVAAIFVIEVGLNFYADRKKPERFNSYVSERERTQAADRLLETFFPTQKKGPGGFAAQNDRRAHVQQIRNRRVN